MKQKQNKLIPWTPEIEDRIRYVNSVYDKARGIGVDVLKLFLQVVIAVNVVPMVFHDRILSTFDDAIIWVYQAWIYIFISIATGFLAYFFIFEGYFKEAAKEEVRWMPNENTKAANIKIVQYDKQSNLLFELSHYSGIASVLSFIFAIAFIIFAILNIE